MTEKEFLEEFCFTLPVQLDAQVQDVHIKMFLEQHHQTYYEVEFISKVEEEEATKNLKDLGGLVPVLPPKLHKEKE